MVVKARLLGSALVAMALAVGVRAQAPWTPLRTPDGHPDLQGYWYFGSATPLERPKEFEGKTFLTAEEAAAFEERTDEHRGDVLAVHAPEWLDYGKRMGTDRRTSLIIDPPDGRVPALTREAQTRQQGRAPVSGETGADRPQDLSLWVRCIGRGMPSAIFPTVYNANVQIVQAPGVVALTYEMIHDTRIIYTDGKPHVGPGIRGYFGDSKGRWEGNTLVVDVANISDKNNYRGSRDTLHLVERFTRVGTALRYEVTAEDPHTWTAPWTAALELEPQPEGMFEYACHEGNNSMRNILSGARATER